MKATLARLALATTIAATPALAQDPLADFDAFVEKQLAIWNAPGASVAVVKDGKVILLRGYGKRDVAKNLPMTADTVVPIASVSKSFTVASLGVLVRDGKLSWDKPVRDYLPDWKTKNDAATLSATPRDLVTHRIGLPRHDYSWYTSDASREDLYKRVQHLEFTYGLRERFQYNNFMYMSAGYLGGKVAGSSWEELVRTGLFVPLDMKASSFTVADLEKQPDHGSGYQLDDNEKPNPIPYRQLTAMGPTGSINSNARDMANYALMYLANGKFGDKVILNAVDVREMTTPQMVMPDARIFEEISATQYGMGLFLSHYRGERYANHGGNMPGASTLFSFLPTKGIGVFVHVNLSSTQLPTVLTFALYDRLLGLPPIDWSKRLKDRYDKGRYAEKEATAQKLSPRKTGTRPAHAVGEYAGEYLHPGYGKITFVPAGGDLKVSYNALTSTMKHYHYEVFEVPANRLDDLEKAKAHFVTDVNGDVTAVAISMDPNVKPIEFARQPDAAFKDPEFLKRFTGVYELGPNPMTVSLRPDGVLVYSFPGGIVRELQGVRKTKFAVKDLPGAQFEFLADASGKVTKAAYYAPSGNYIAVKK